MLMVALSEPQKRNQNQCIKEPLSSSATMKDMGNTWLHFQIKIGWVPEATYAQREVSFKMNTWVEGT